MRRTGLLLASMALVALLVSGVAWAANITCTTNPCEGTPEADTITGTPGNDEIFARDGTDRLNGGAGNDLLDGGGGGSSDSDPHTTKDFYFLTTNWGSDTVTDADGTDNIEPVPDGGATAAAMPNLTINLVSGTGPEVTDGNGNTVNWNDNVIENVSTGAGDDVISQSPDSQLLTGSTGNDTYQGYAAVSSQGGFGGDTITDVAADGASGGTADVLDLSSRNLADAALRTPKSSSTSNVRGLQIDFIKGPYLCVEEACRYVIISQYFDNTSTEACASGPGPGLLETIKFADDPNVDFAQVRSLLGCPPLETAITSMTMEPWEASTKTTFRFSSNDGEATFECKLDGGTFERCTSPKEYPGLSEGSTHTFEVRAVDPAGNPDPTPARRTWTVDTTPPMVNSNNPGDNATGIAPTASVGAFFSEEMDRSTLTAGTFTLTKQGSSTPVSARVEVFSDLKKVLLTPSSALEANTTYTARIKGGSAGAKDLTGNALTQDHVWTFTTGASTAPGCTKTGTANAETISGTSAADVICAGGGNDTLKGLGGNDILKGEAGNDKLLGGLGDDTLDGGELGSDTASYTASLTAVIASLATNTSTGEGSDTFVGVEHLSGSSKADTLTGSATNNTLTGGGGNDQVVGGGGADTLKGSGGADAVDSKDGVNGNDSLDGGAGTDTKVTDATERSIVGFP